MYINNKNITEYDSSLIESVRGVKRIRKTLTKVNSRYIKGYEKSIEGFDYDITLLVKANSKSQLEARISLMTKELAECFIRELDFDFIYECVLQDEQVEKYDYDVLEDKEMAIISYGLFVIDKFTEENEIEFSKSVTLILNNTEVTPCVLELTPTQPLVDVTIKGLGEDIIIKNLTTDKLIVIDGEKGLVLENGLNKWEDYNSWSFPKLHPGENIISVDKASINAKLKYKARWI